MSAFFVQLSMLVFMAVVHFYCICRRVIGAGNVRCEESGVESNRGQYHSTRDHRFPEDQQQWGYLVIRSQ